MQHIYERIGEMLVPSAHVNVDMLESNTSATTLATDTLRPCLWFLWDFNYYDPHSDITNNMCFIEHYSFLKDETSQSPT